MNLPGESAVLAHVRSLDDAQLRLLFGDVTSGRFAAQLRAEFDRRESLNSQSCTVCTSEIANSHQSFTLIFGPSDFRRRAVFCAGDCMEHFLSELKSMMKKEGE